jgi:hypothetical protein
MDEHEIARRASALPSAFADRVSSETLESLKLMDEGGEYGELMIELTASLAASHAPVTRREKDELLALLQATGMPAEDIERLAVRA